MKFIYTLLLLFLIMGGMAGELFSQKEKKTDRWNIQLNLQHKDISVLSELYIGQLQVSHQVWIRPFYSLDIQRSFFNNPGFKFFFTGQIGYYANLYSDHWTSWDVGLGLEKRILKKFFLSLRYKIGRASWQARDVQYIYEGDQWVRSPNPANPEGHNLRVVRLDLGYRLREGNHPIDIIGNTQLSILKHTDYGPIPYGAAGIGIRYGL
ncbi:MAG: hypothetical protein AAFR87_12380 [Bacteroidota bacterium]